MKAVKAAEAFVVATVSANKSLGITKSPSAFNVNVCWFPKPSSNWYDVATGSPSPIFNDVAPSVR